MQIDGLLFTVGIILILAGVIGGIAGWTSIDHESYQTAKEIYEDLYDNEIAEASYVSAKTIWISQVSLVLSSAIGAIIGGLLLLGIAKMIELQIVIANTLAKTEDKTAA
jgi:hypothetical protein